MAEKTVTNKRKFIAPGAALAIFVVIVSLLWDGHQAHLLAALPYVILLLCPVLHLFMHGKHGGH